MLKRITQKALVPHYLVTEQRRTIACLTHLRLARHSKILSESDPFGEKASLSETEFLFNQLSGIDADKLGEISESKAVEENVFSHSEGHNMMTRIKRTMKIAHDSKANNITEQEQEQVMKAQALSDNELRAAATLTGGVSQWLDLPEADRKQILNDMAYADRKNTDRQNWEKKSYSTYEEYVQKELIGATAGDLGRPIAGDNPVGQRSTIEDSPYEFEDVDADPSAALATPKLEVSEATGADQTINEADAMRHEVDELLASTPETENTPESQTSPDGVYILPKTDPSKWNTEDVIAWLDCFAEEGIMDEEMMKTFRMVGVDGEMLLNKVMPPNLFKIMRKWHLHRSNPKTRELAENLVVPTEVIQYTIYLCFPYCGQMS